MLAGSKRSGKLYDGSLNPDSESTLRKSSLVTREPISIFSRIRNEKGKEKEKFNQILEALREELPEGFKIGAAVAEGSCFFDSVAQGFNELKSKVLSTSNNNFNIKLLREDCTNSVNKYRNEILRDAVGGGYFVPQENVAFPYLGNIKDKDGRTVQDESKTFDKYLKNIKNAAEKDRLTIWGRTEIEGKMMCQNYGAGIKVIELRDEPIGESKLYVTTAEVGQGDHIVYIVNYIEHFVPLLKNIEKDVEESKSVSKEVYGLGDGNNSSLVDDQVDYESDIETLSAESTTGATWGYPYENLLSSEFRSKLGCESSSASSSSEWYSALISNELRANSISLTKDEVVERATFFVKVFTREFEKKISEYAEEVRPVSKVRKASKGSAALDHLIRSSVGPGVQSPGVEPPYIGGQFCYAIPKKVVDSCLGGEHRKKAKAVLVKAGLEIFQKFEKQFTRVIDVNQFFRSKK